MVDAEILLINITFYKSIYLAEFHPNLIKGCMATFVSLESMGRFTEIFFKDSIQQDPHTFLDNFVA